MKNVSKTLIGHFFSSDIPLTLISVTIHRDAIKYANRICVIYVPLRIVEWFLYIFLAMIYCNFCKCSFLFNLKILLTHLQMYFAIVFLISVFLFHIIGSILSLIGFNSYRFEFYLCFKFSSVRFENFFFWVQRKSNKLHSNISYTISNCNLYLIQLSLKISSRIFQLRWKLFTNKLGNAVEISLRSDILLLLLFFFRHRIRYYRLILRVSFFFFFY